MKVASEKLTPLSAAKQRRRNDDVWGTMGVEDLFLLVSLNIFEYGSFAFYLG